MFCIGGQSFLRNYVPLPRVASPPLVLIRCEVSDSTNRWIQCVEATEQYLPPVNGLKWIARILCGWNIILMIAIRMENNKRKSFDDEWLAELDETLYPQPSLVWITQIYIHCNSESDCRSFSLSLSSFFPFLAKLKCVFWHLQEQFGKDEMTNLPFVYLGGTNISIKESRDDAGYFFGFKWMPNIIWTRSRSGTLGFRLIVSPTLTNTSTEHRLLLAVHVQPVALQVKSKQISINRKIAIWLYHIFR